jgi:D-glycero-beta-D-manno-heptose 1-phosphate adenylyltransferase
VPSAKILPLAELAERVDAARRSGCTIALANGGFDLLHVGHVRYLRAARAQADRLVVALNSDASLRGLKGERRALIDERGRLELIAALACVDWVTLFDEPRVDRVLLTLRPEVHCKGSDYTAETVPERDVVAAYGGRVAIVGGDKVRSSSTVIRRIRELHAVP